MTHPAPGWLAPVALFAAALPTSGSAQALTGETIFKQRCAMCHAVAAGKPSPLGPNLAGVVGRKAGATTYAYSPAMKGATLVWTKPVLDTYLASPTKMVAGTKMVIALPDAKQRALVIGYLATLK
jgi:cytochrome c